MPSLLRIHCLAAPGEEQDHVLPRSWYPDGTDPKVQRLTVPSCKACGAKLKIAEEMKKRRDRIESIMRRVQPIVPSPAEAIGVARMKVRTPAGLLIEAAVGLRFNHEHFDAVISKFVRGLYFYRNKKKALPAATKVITFHPSYEVMKEAAQFERGSLSDGLLYSVGQFDDGRMLWFFILWGQVNIGAAVDPREPHPP